MISRVIFVTPVTRALSLFGAAGLVLGATVLSHSAADAAVVTCPTVSSSGVVSPAPSAKVDWAGCELAGADLAGADLTGANITGLAQLNGANLTKANLTDADLSGSDADATFTGADLVETDLAGTYLSGSDFAGTDLEGADLFHATTDVSWTGATCPDNTKAASHSTGCADILTYRFAGYSTPKSGSTLAKSTKKITVEFKLATVTGARLTPAIGASLQSDAAIRVAFSGSGITTVTSSCSWIASSGEFTCTITVPKGIKSGSKYPYHITAQETPGTSFQTAPALHGIVNPESIYFRS
jgi:hypothetical protein